MKVRHVIGIIILVIALLCFGPMVLAAGLQVQEIPQHQFKWWYGSVLFAVPAAVLTLVGALVVGPGQRLHAIAWTCLGGALYGGTLLLTMAPMMASPGWTEMMASMQAQQGQRPLTMSLMVERPIYLTVLLAVIGAAALYLHHVVLKKPATGDGTSVNPGSAMADGARPLSVTVLSWFLIVTSIVGSAGYLFNMANLDASMKAAVDAFGGPPVATQTGLGIAVLLLWALCGVFILRGANWARWLLVTLSVVGPALSLLLYQQLWAVVPGLLWLAIFVYILFIRAPAVAWFTRNREDTALEA